eukprot:11802094-Alexandrium_andersonii.AAC.1
MQACERQMHACSAAMRTTRNRSMSGTERPTSAQRPAPGSLDRPTREQLRAADSEHDPADRVDEDPIEERGRLGDLEARPTPTKRCDRGGSSAAAAKCGPPKIAIDLTTDGLPSP